MGSRDVLNPRMTRSSPAERAQRALARLESVTDNEMFLMSIRYYTAVLAPGAWVEPRSPRRCRFKKAQLCLESHLWVARRTLNIAARKGKKGCLFKLPSNYERFSGRQRTIPPNAKCSISCRRTKSARHGCNRSEASCVILTRMKQSDPVKALRRLERVTSDCYIDL
jgi:hypothetical protein